MTKRHVSIVLLILLLLLIASVIILSLVPPVAKDELVHHLAVPKLYLKHGGMYEIPFMPFSYYPMNLQLLYLVPLYFGNDIAPKFMHFSFAILTASLIFVYLRRRLGNSYALFGALFFLSIPIVVKLSISAYVDLAVIFFTFASLFFLLRWIESGFRMRFLVYSAIMCGLGLGTKYNGLIVLLLFTLLVPFAYSRYRQGPKPGFFGAAAQGLIFLFIALLIFSPWMARNYQWKKNPIYPLYDQAFNPPELSPQDSIAFQSQKSKPGIFALREALYQETWWEMALLPIRVFFQGKDGDPKYFDGKLSPFLLVFPFFAFGRFRRDPANVKMEKTIFAGFTFFYFFLAFFSSGLRIRYIAFFIPPLVVLSVFGIHRLQETMAHSLVISSETRNLLTFKDYRISPFSRNDLLDRNPFTRYFKSSGLKTILSLMIVLSPLVYNAAYVKGQFKQVDPFSYFSGSVTRDEYIARFRPEHPAVLFINKDLPEDALVSLIFLGNRGYYLDREYVYGEEELLLIEKNAETAVDIFKRLKSSGVTHLFIYDPLFGRWVIDNLEEEAKDSLKSFLLNYVKIVYSKNGFSVLALRNVSS